MIPKIIHYCWFGGNPLPESAIKCIESWKKYFPDYEIKEWNESNYDVHKIPYIHEAYEAKKYAFVSDYARFDILYQYGGIYFDTDVEVIKSMDDIIAKGPFFGIEVDGDEKKDEMPKVAPGLCLGANPGMEFYKTFLEELGKHHFIVEGGFKNTVKMLPLTRKLLKARGMQNHNRIQEVDGFTLYPAEYFNPLEYATGELHITPNTRSIHWYMASWTKPQPEWMKKLKQFMRRILKKIKK